MRRLTEDERDLTGRHVSSAKWMARRFGGGDLAHDAAVDGLMYAAKRFDGRGAFSTYARHRTRGAILNAREKSRRSCRFSPIPPASLSRARSLAMDDDGLRRVDSEDEVSHVLSHLSARTRRMVLMRMCGLTQREIAERSGSDQANVSDRLSRAAEVLRPLCERRGLL